MDLVVTGKSSQLTPAGKEKQPRTLARGHFLWGAPCLSLWEIEGVQGSCHHGYSNCVRAQHSCLGLRIVWLKWCYSHLVRNGQTCCVQGQAGGGHPSQQCSLPGEQGGALGKGNKRKRGLDFNSFASCKTKKQQVKSWFSYTEVRASEGGVRTYKRNVRSRGNNFWREATKRCDGLTNAI